MRGVRGRNLIAVDYEPVDGVLVCRFSKSGEYRYKGVPENVYQSLLKVPFADSYFTKVIKGKFPVEKPERESNGKGSHVQDTAGRVCDSGTQRDAGKHGEPSHGDSGRRAVQQVGLPLCRPDAQAAGGRVVEVFRPEDGVTFTEDPHAYHLNGKRVAFSLTQVLELAGISRQPTDASEIAARPAAAKRGTKVHEYTLWDDQGELDMEDLKPYPDYHNRVLGWRQFREDFHFEPDLTTCEIPLVVVVNGMTYAMKLDALGTIGEGDNLALAVVEKKCTAQIESSVAIQTAGQALAFRDRAETLQMPLKRFVVQLSDKLNAAGRYYKCVEHTERNDEKIFVAAALANVYWRFNHGLLKGN
jgi:hypothetical protein